MQSWRPAGRVAELGSLKRGEVFLPRLENHWRPILEAEWLSWTGDERQQADQIDAAAYAAILANEKGDGVIRLQRPVVRM